MNVEHIYILQMCEIDLTINLKFDNTCFLIDKKKICFI